MLRRSAPALLGLTVCLFAAHLATASGALGLDESKIRIILDAGRTSVRLPVSNGTGHDFNARLRVELLDTDDAVISSSETVARVRRGTNSFEAPLDLRYAELPKSERDEFPWFRLRYRLAADDAGADSLRFSVNYDRAAAGVNEEVTCSVEAERVGGRGYGMLLGEVGLPPGADVDRASLERALKESGKDFTCYDVLPDRVVVYLWPREGAAFVVR